MKKLLALFLILTMIFTFVALLSSCNLLNPNPPVDEEAPENEVSGEENPPEEDDPDAENPPVSETPEVRTTITEEDLRAHEEIINFSFRADVVGDAVGSNGTMLQSKYDFSYMQNETANKMYYVYEFLNAAGETEAEEYEQFVLFNDGKGYSLNKNGDQYYRSLDGSHELLNCGFVNPLLEDFSSHSYDEEKKAYKVIYTEYAADIVLGIPISELYFYFKNGVISKIEMNGEGSSPMGGEDFAISVSVVMVFSDIGKTEINIPNYIDETAITEKVWNSFSDINNYTARGSGTMIKASSDGTEETEYLNETIKVTEDAYYSDGMNEEELWALSDGVWCKVTEGEDGYIGSVDEEFEYKTLGEMFDFIEYSDLNYIQEEGKYEFRRNWENGYQEFSFSFRNGKIVRVDIYGYLEDDYVENTMNFAMYFDIGYTEIEVPSFTVVE